MISKIRASATTSINTSLCRSQHLWSPQPGEIHLACPQKVNAFKIFTTGQETKCQLREHSWGLATRPLSKGGCQVLRISCYTSHKMWQPSHAIPPLCQDAQSQLGASRASRHRKNHPSSLEQLKKCSCRNKSCKLRCSSNSYKDCNSKRGERLGRTPT